MEFYAASEGYYEKQRESVMVVRFASYRIAESFAGTKALKSIGNFWPMGEDNGETKKIEMTKERYEAILKRHNLKVK
jgi:hypothetical protein